jgi:protocatechuate 3,4-dioxygenase beta subunit
MSGARTLTEYEPDHLRSLIHDPLTTCAPNRRELVIGGVATLALGALQMRLPAPAGAQEAVSPTTDFCMLTPEMTSGPFYLVTDLLREDITEGTPGVPLQLQIRVVDSMTCSPLANAAVDIWHCDAQGFYSGVGAQPGMGASKSPVVDSGTFLRGIQLTDDDGVAEFTTIYPGWYTGRTAHIHLMVHLDGQVVDDDSYERGYIAHTGQLFFDDAISDEIYLTHEAYAGRDESRRTRNEQDRILDGRMDEPGFLVSLTPVDENDPCQGYIGVVTVGIDPRPIKWPVAATPVS